MKYPPVNSITHATEKRAHIPSGEEAGYEAGSKQVKESADQIHIPVNPIVQRGQDPELNWMDKYKTADLRIPVRSLYRHEHIAPETLVKGLYRLVATEAKDQPDLFSVNAMFGNALDHEELDKISDYYTHSDGWTNRLIQGDSLLTMTSLLEREGMAGQVQCIYIDPPYGIKYGSNWQIKLNNRTVTDGQDDSLSGEPEQIKAFRDTWELGIHSYLSYLRDRLLVAKQLLHDSGSCFVQISDENVHLVRCLMDEVFGSGNFCAFITFRKKMMPMGSDVAEGVSDYLLWYAKDRERVKSRPIFQPKAVEGSSVWSNADFPDGTRRKLTREEIDNHKLLPPGTRVFQSISLLPAQYRKNQDFVFEFEGQKCGPPKGSCWKTDRKGMDACAAAKRLVPSGDTLRYVLYHEDYPVGRITNLWADTAGADDIRYVVQSNTNVIQRCILMTTDPGDIVLDPTCGSGTTAYVAEQWGRRWITIDTSRIALNIAKTRLMTATFPFYTLYDTEDGERAVLERKAKAGKHVALEKRDATQPLRGHNVRYGFVYKKVPHITLGSIANNEPAAEETLYDQPLEDKKRLRVAGPFTVETLQSYEPISPEELARQREQVEELSAFEDLIFEHLKSAGVKTGDKSQQAVFTRIDRLSSTAIHAEGFYETKAGEKKAYLHIGPKFGTVSKQAVTEAIKACRDKRDADWLLILGFAFEGGITELSRSFGTFQVSIVRMHDDLLQEGLLKRDKKAASFVTIGEPDIGVVSGKWIVDSDGKAVCNLHECEILSGLGSLEAIHGLGCEGLRKLADLAQRGDLRVDQSGASGSGVGAVQHRRGRVKADDGRVSAVAGTREGVAGGTGDANDSGVAAGLSEREQICRDLDCLRRDRPDAFRARQVAVLEGLTTSHWPLTTRTLAVASVRGLDIYDPIRDEVQSRDVHDIAYWMLDDAYDGSNFVVRQVFFCGGDKDEFDQWKKELSNLAAAAAKKKAEQTLRLQIDDEAFASAYGHISRPFPFKPGQTVAVRVVSQFGEETTKVLGEPAK